ncbi:hypothetical protein NKY66_10950 [Sinorhizobium meliloti]|uniref:hypothetical protein n=1 Tax=Rhizobium meliloti TaxID=382 RepID=UPI003D64D3B5
MKTVHLDWSDTEGVGFLLRTKGFWNFEIEEITMALEKAGYTAHTPDHFVSAVQPRPDGRDRIADELEKIGYGVDHGDSDVA